MGGEGEKGAHLPLFLLYPPPFLSQPSSAWSLGRLPCLPIDIIHLIISPPYTPETSSSLSLLKQKGTLFACCPLTHGLPSRVNTLALPKPPCLPAFSSLCFCDSYADLPPHLLFGQPCETLAMPLDGQGDRAWHGMAGQERHWQLEKHYLTPHLSLLEAQKKKRAPARQTVNLSIFWQLLPLPSLLVSGGLFT